MKFKIHAEKNAADKTIFLYDNETNVLSTWDGFVFEDPSAIKKWEEKDVSVPFSKDSPMKKSRRIKVLKIQLGLSCNYSCSYCSQRFVERADETNKKDVDGFMKKLEHLEFDEKEGLRIEFWGGEPLVYIKTILPLFDKLQEKFESWETKPKYSMITNGSLLTDDTCNWLYDNKFSIAVSHDGPGQYLRGPDPFNEPELRERILAFYRRMRPEGRMSFNAMLNAGNTSRKKVFDWFVDLTGDQNMVLGEGGLIDAYDTDGLTNLLFTKEQHFSFRREAFNDIFSTDGDIGFHGIREKIDDFTRSVISHRSSEILGQKCGMDDENIVAVDLRGNVVTCQNVSAVSTAMNGMPHLSGNIVNMDAVKIRTGTHWKNRPHCAGCPVLHLCQGACLFLEGEYWERSCDNAYSDAVTLMALSIQKITGYIPYLIEADHLPKSRQDIWGTVFEHEEVSNPENLLPTPVIQSKITVNEVEVFTKASVGEWYGR